MQRYYLLFDGIVQGVGFRWTMASLAHKYNLSGYCRNLKNGCVEAEIEGNNDNIETFLKEILSQKTFIKITDYRIKAIEVKGSNIFEVKY